MTWRLSQGLPALLECMWSPRTHNTLQRWTAREFGTREPPPPPQNVRLGRVDHFQLKALETRRCQETGRFGENVPANETHLPSTRECPPPGRWTLVTGQETRREAHTQTLSQTVPRAIWFSNTHLLTLPHPETTCELSISALGGGGVFLFSCDATCITLNE